MDDSSGKTSSSSSTLAIIEKRPQRPGGCVGIFFQLFDWNRRLAKKKLFSKKLLPPARAKRASKKFGGDDKLPAAKLLLIAEENRGGFPNVKKSDLDVDNSANAERNHEMRSPSLVARLMGLESMPAARRDKPKKAFFSEFNLGHGKKPENNYSTRNSEHFVCDQEDFHLGKGHTKLESRPQKLQKTGLFERRAVTRFGAEALQFKSVLSRSRKHHPKLASPVKSPRVGRNAVRLMEAATKILEPGLNATNRAKCALSYTPAFHYPSKDDIMDQGTSFLTMEDSKQPCNYANASKPLKGQSSCKSCGNWLDVVDSRLNVEEQVPVLAPSALGLGSTHPLGPGRSKMKPTESTCLQDRDLIAPEDEEQPLSRCAEAKGNRQTRSKNFVEMKLALQEDQEHYRMSSQRMKSQKDLTSVTVLHPRNKRQNQMSLAKDRGSLRPKLNNVDSRRDPFTVSSVNGGKDFVAVNRNSISRTKASMPSKVLDNCKIDRERNALDKRDDSSRLRASVRKRRSMNGTAQAESTSFTQSTSRKQRDVRSDVIIGKLVGSSANSKNPNRVKSELPVEAKGDAGGSRKDDDVISFTFSSPMRHNTDSLSPTKIMEKTRGQGEFMSINSSHKKKLATDTNMGKPISHLDKQLRGDALGALLEEKLKELTCRDRDDTEMGDAPGRSTASILEELIFALTAERPTSSEDENKYFVGLNQEDNSSYDSQHPSDHRALHCQKFNANQKLQAEPISHGVLVGFPHGGDSEQPSPGSVLGVSFSNDSCFSESPDGDTGKLPSESMESSYNQLQPSEFDAELSDCATSLSTGRTTVDRVTDSFDNLQSVLHGIDHADSFLGNEHNRNSDVIINAEILLGSLCDDHSVVDFPVALILDKLETLPNALWTGPKFEMGFMGAKDENRRGRFLFDCLIEFLESKYGHYCRSRFKTWPSLPLHIYEESLAREVYEEIRRWADFAGKSSDDIIEREMNHSLGKWMDFEMEEFDIGETIESAILKSLVNEVVIDIGQCRPCS